MTPMIDVVFLLIIFFLVSSHLARQETQLELPLPTADSGQAPAQTEQPRLTINVLQDGTVLLTGQRVTPDQLKSRLAEGLARSGQDIELRIRADRATPYANVEPIMLACTEVGIWNLTYAVYRKQDER